MEEAKNRVLYLKVDQTAVDRLCQEVLSYL